MNFSWPLVLLLLLLIPLLLFAYVWMMRRKRKFAVRHASLMLIREALPRRTRWRRHVPAALFLISIASLVLAAARPQAVVAVPTARTSIILALDVSLSMCATDVEPNRLAVAQDVARAFVEDQGGEARIGIVAFGGFAQLAVAPTNQTGELVESIENLTTSRGTAIGSAILRSVDAIAEVNPDVTRIGVDVSDGTAGEGGSFEPDVIVLLTDGATTQGVHPIIAAEQAVDRGIRVYTIGFGTEELVPLVCSREQLGNETFGGFGGFGGGGFGGPGGQGPPRQFLVLDEDTLRAVADMTGGVYHRAEDANELVNVFRDLPTEIASQDEERELSVAFAGVGGLFAVVAFGLSLAWNRYP